MFAARWGICLLLAVFGCVSTPPTPPPAGESTATPLPGAERPDASAPQSARPAQVLFVSIAGLEPGAYTPAPGREPLMPNLAHLAETGVRADAVTAVAPPTHFSTHATLVTGRRPDAHGIVSNQLLDATGVQAMPFWEASRLRGDSLWSATTAAKKGVAALAWPSTLGADIDWLLPDVAPLRADQQWIPLLQQTTTPWLLQRILEDVPDPQPVGWPTAAERDALLMDLACDIARSGTPPALWLLRLSQPAGPLRVAGPNSDAARSALAAADKNVERLLDCLSGAGLLRSSAVVVVGDQVWEPVHSLIQPNIALRRASLIGRDPRVETGIGAWQAIVRSNGGSAFVYAKDEGAALRAREVLRPEAARTRAFRIVSASEMAALRADPEAWFGLEAAPGYVFGDSATGSFVVQPTIFRGASGYLLSNSERAVGFVAWGRGLRRGVTVPVMPAIDIAPTLAALLDVSLDSEGRPLYGILSFDPRNPKRGLPKREQTR